MSDYEKNANDFAEKYGITLKVLDKDYKDRWWYKIKLNRNKKSYSLWWGQGIMSGDTEPRMYDILACITKSDPEDFEWFCGNYGYDTNSRTAKKMYKSTVKEWEAVERLFGDILEELSEIW